MAQSGKEFQSLFSIPYEENEREKEREREGEREREREREKEREREREREGENIKESRKLSALYPAFSVFTFSK